MRPLNGPQDKYRSTPRPKAKAEGVWTKVCGHFHFHMGGAAFWSFLVVGNDAWRLLRDFVGLASTGPFGLNFTLVRARSRSHFRGSDPGGGSNLCLPSHSSISSRRHSLPSPIPWAPTPQGLQR